MTKNEQIRAGILLTIRQNRFVARMLYFGYRPYGRDVARARYGPRTHVQMRVVLSQLNRRFLDLGGTAAELRQSVWVGAGLSQIGQLSGRTMSNSSSDGGGGSSVTALINAVASLMTAIMNALNRAKPNDPNDPVPDEYLPDDEEDSLPE